jgi:hypothetical protein
VVLVPKSQVQDLITALENGIARMSQKSSTSRTMFGGESAIKYGQNAIKRLKKG